MPKQKRDAELTKRKILQTSMKLFSFKGFDATTVDDIASKSNINKAMVYYYYKNKAGLYEQVMSVLMENIYLDIDKEYKKSITAKDALKAFIMTYGKYAQKHPYFPSLLLRELSNSGAKLPEKMFFKMRRIFLLLSEILKKGVDDGVFFDVKPMMVHFMIMGTINLMITTQPMRIKATKLGDIDIDTCSACSVEEISEYVYEKVKLMLEKSL